MIGCLAGLRKCINCGSGKGCEGHSSINRKERILALVSVCYCMDIGFYLGWGAKPLGGFKGKKNIIVH